MNGCAYVGQVAYGVGELPGSGKEAVARQWVAVIDRRREQLLRSSTTVSTARTIPKTD